MRHIALFLVVGAALLLPAQAVSATPHTRESSNGQPQTDQVVVQVSSVGVETLNFSPSTLGTRRFPL
jgi:hypothetical protein